MTHTFMFSPNQANRSQFQSFTESHQQDPFQSLQTTHQSKYDSNQKKRESIYKGIILSSNTVNQNISSDLNSRNKTLNAKKSQDIINKVDHSALRQKQRDDIERQKRESQERKVIDEKTQKLQVMLSQRIDQNSTQQRQITRSLLENHPQRYSNNNSRNEKSLRSTVMSKYEEEKALVHNRMNYNMTQMNGSLWNEPSNVSVRETPSQSLNVKNRHLYPVNCRGKDTGESDNDALKNFALYMSPSIQEHMMHQKAVVNRSRHPNALPDQYQDCSVTQSQRAGITRTRSIVAPTTRTRPDSGNLLKRNLRKIPVSNRASNDRLNRSIDVHESKARLTNMQQMTLQFSPLQATNGSGLAKQAGIRQSSRLDLIVQKQVASPLKPLYKRHRNASQTYGESPMPVGAGQLISAEPTIAGLHLGPRQDSIDVGGNDVMNTPLERVAVGRPPSDLHTHDLGYDLQLSIQKMATQQPSLYASEGVSSPDKMARPQNSHNEANNVRNKRNLNRMKLQWKDSQAQ